VRAGARKGSEIDYPEHGLHVFSDAALALTANRDRELQYAGVTQMRTKP
jgi:hypothetical protein